MKKVVIALLLIVAPCLVGVPHLVAQSGGEVKLDDPAEANAYNNAIGQADPKSRAAALDAFLTQYPNSKVKDSALETMMNDYSQAGNVPKAMDAAARLVALEPNNLDGLASLVFYKRATAGDKPDAATLDQISHCSQVDGRFADDLQQAESRGHTHLPRRAGLCRLPEEGLQDGDL
jgi:hypothetical protein